MQKQVISWRGSYVPVRRLVNYNGVVIPVLVHTIRQHFTNMDLVLSREGNRNGQRNQAIACFNVTLPNGDVFYHFTCAFIERARSDLRKTFAKSSKHKNYDR